MKLWTRVVSCRNAVWEMAPDVDGMVCTPFLKSYRALAGWKLTQAFRTWWVAPAGHRYSASEPRRVRGGYMQS